MTITKVLMPNYNYKALKAVMTKDKHREQLQVINFQKEFVESTDGKMLIRIKIETGIECGAYRVIKETKLGKYHIELVLEKTDILFSDTQRVIPIENDEYLALDIDSNCLGVSQAIINIFQYSETAFNHEMIDKLSILNSQWNVYKYGKEKPCLFTSEKGKYIAVIMPFCIKELRVNKLTKQKHKK